MCYGLIGVILVILWLIGIPMLIGFILTALIETDRVDFSEEAIFPIVLIIFIINLIIFCKVV